MENEREKLVQQRKAQEINESDQMNIPDARNLLIENETPQDKTLSNNDINTEKITDTSKSKNAFSPAPQNSDKEKRRPPKKLMSLKDLRKAKSDQKCQVIFTKNNKDNGKTT